MHKTAIAGLAVSAFMLAGCKVGLSHDETQAQLDAAFSKIDSLPTFTEDRFQSFSDPEGDCAVSYSDLKRGVVYERRGVIGDDMRFYLPQAVQVDCEDLQGAYNRVATTIAVDNVNVHGSLDVKSDLLDYKKSITNSIRYNENWGKELTSISTFGL